ncbi:MAG: response regulator [Planctomycetia bacterium]|nr:response regulator [Planctomycetia bacterium]
MTSAPCPEAPAPDPTVLVVDDSPVDRELASAVLEQQLGCRVVQAASGQEALDLLRAQVPSAVLTDLLMPGIDGLQLVEIIRRQSPQLPIVLMTGQGSEELAIRALVRGAASYVPKRNLESDLAGTIEQVLAAARQHRQLQRLQECVTRLEYHFALENDRTLVPVLVSFLQEHISNLRLCDESGRLRVGVALEEALLNAMIHGNLEVGSELRQQGDEPYYAAIAERLGTLPYGERRVHVHSILSRSEAVFIIRDEGPGFHPKQLPDPTDLANLDKISGRGLLLIHTFMDEVRYNERGNQITLIKRRPTGGTP